MIPAQAMVAAFLGDGAAYGKPGAEVVRIDTHAAMVFLVGDRAYKMKRQVRFSFLDFSTLNRRHAALAAELRLNLRTAPAIYRGLLPVVVTAEGDLRLGGEGDIVEWLLEMTRFEQANLLANKASAGRLDDTIIDALARAIADLHRSGEIDRNGGGYDAMAAVIDGNAADLRAIVAVDGEVQHLTEQTRALLDRHRVLLEQRRRNGFVRHCHGDLHLGNIVMFEGAPVLFDCLEFDAALATVDTYYDLAFLLTDLWDRGQPSSANRLLNGYLEMTLDDSGVALLPLFMSVRATIRAKVEGFAANLEKDEVVRARHLRDARGYVALGSQLLVAKAARLIAIGGVSGSGKSTVARAVAADVGPAPGAIVLRSDVVRKRLFGVDPAARLPATAYTPEVSGQVYATLSRRAAGLVGAGRAVIVDATFLNPAARAKLASIADRVGVPFDGIWLAGDPRVLAARIERRRTDPSDASVGVLARQLTHAPAPADWTVVDANGPADEVFAATHMALCGGPQQA